MTAYDCSRAFVYRNARLPELTQHPGQIPMHTIACDVQLY